MHSFHLKFGSGKLKNETCGLSPADHCPKSFPAGGGAREIPDFSRRKVYCRFQLKKAFVQFGNWLRQNLNENCGCSPADHCPKAFPAGGGARELPDLSRRKIYC